jgi:hypothetical protein
LKINIIYLNTESGAGTSLLAFDPAVLFGWGWLSDVNRVGTRKGLLQPLLQRGLEPLIAGILFRLFDVG